MKPKKPDMGTLGSSGLRHSGGRIDEEVDRLLRDRTKRFKLYSKMRNSASIGAVIYSIKALARQVKWHCEPAEPTNECLAQASFVDECLNDMSLTLDDFVSETLTFLEFGFAAFEIIYKIRRGPSRDSRLNSHYTDGKIGWRKFAARAQDTVDRWEINPDDGGIEGLYQIDTYANHSRGAEVFIPIDKLLLFRTSTERNNPEGRSIFRSCVQDWQYLEKIMRIELVGVERDLTGLPTFEVPLELLQGAATGGPERDFLEQIKEQLSQLRRDEREYAIVPSQLDAENFPTGYKFSLLTASGSRQVDTDVIKRWYEMRILKSFMAQFLELGLGQTGSFALAENTTNMFAVSLGSYLDVIGDVFSRFAIGRLMTANGVPRHLWPTLHHSDIESRDLQKLGSYVGSLAASGVLPVGDEGLTKRLLDFAGLPPPYSDGDEGY